MPNPGFIVRFRNQAYLTVLVLAAILRFVEAVRRPLEADEGLSLTIGSLNPLQMLAYLRTDVHPPLFFLVLHGFESVHTPIWTIRLSMAASGVVSVALLMLIVRAWSSPNAALAAGVCAAFMPSLIFYDTWIRMYAPFQMLDMLAIWLLTLLATRDYSGIKRVLMWSAWIAANAAALYVHYLAWMTLVAQVAFSSVRSRKLFLQALAGAALATLLWLPQLPAFIAQLPVGGLAYGWAGSHTMEALWWLPGQATVVPELEGWPAQAGAAVVWVWIVSAFACAWPRMKGTILPWLAAPAAFTIAYSLLAHKQLYIDRYHLLLAYALAAWSGVAFARLAERSRRGTLAACGGAILLAAVGCGYAVNPSLYTADWGHVADVLARHSEPTDLIVFEQGSSYLGFKYYQSDHRYAILQVSDPDQLGEASRVIDRYQRVWLIGSEIRAVDPSLRLLAHLEGRYSLMYFEESNRLLPSEDVSIGLFARR